MLIGTGTLVACSNDDEACASQPLTKPPGPSRTNNRPSSGRTTSKVQDRTNTNKSGKSGKATQRPTNWSGYNERVKQHNWSKPYRAGFPTPQQPVIIHQYGHDYRTYPGYGGYYPVGTWPIGYGERYGCRSEKESQPDTTSSPTPEPTVTVTEPVTPTRSSTPTTPAAPIPTASPTNTPSSSPSSSPVPSPRPAA
ncbi:hypothetical protein ACFV9C_42680 [Kribbella sp. NPDC059898]|uniref:hypothetical protein n=1 Tax=Kribbella sp. NPDC059898 TaxID=3346995 RepID=UPI003654360C